MGAFEKYGWEEEKIISKTGLRYLVRLQDYVLKNSQGKEEAVMFSFSYLRIPQDSRRPVMFAYNGGPGAPVVGFIWGFWDRSRFLFLTIQI